MDLTCLVIPRAGLVPVECKRLGEALYRWLSFEPAVRSVEPLGLDDLRDGELPQPRYLRHTWSAQGRTPKGLSLEQKEEIRKTLAERADARDLECHIRNVSGQDIRLAVLGFDQAIPGYLVEDILIDGKSWKEFSRGG
jgi:hypothetical protein